MTLHGITVKMLLFASQWSATPDLEFGLIFSFHYLIFIFRLLIEFISVMSLKLYVKNILILASNLKKYLEIATIEKFKFVP